MKNHKTTQTHIPIVICSFRGVKLHITEAPSFRSLFCSSFAWHPRVSQGLFGASEDHLGKEEGSFLTLQDKDPELSRTVKGQVK
jgi:hypothetical protein